MATKKSSDKRDSKSSKSSGAVTSSRSTVSGPSRRDKRASATDAPERKMAGTQTLAAAMPFNPNKAGEHGKAALQPRPGATVSAPEPSVTGSTLTERTASPKVGRGEPQLGIN